MTCTRCRTTIVAAVAMIATFGLLLALAGCGSSTPAETHEATASSAPVAIVEPVAITIPSLELAAPVDRTGLNPDGTVAVPGLDRPERAAWVDQGPTPGATGRALIVGHVNGNGHPGVFADLATIAVGAEIVVTDAGGVDRHFTVTEVGQAPKNAFPAGRVYGDTDHSELALVTCGGELDTTAHSYLANTIVFATASTPAGPA